MKPVVAPCCSSLPDVVRRNPERLWRQNEREFIRDANQAAVLPPSADVSGMTKTKYTHGEPEKMNQQYGYVPALHGQHAERCSAVQKIRKSEHGACH